MTKDNFKNWLKAALIRAVRTMAQTAVAVIGSSAILAEVDWSVVISSSILAGIVSLLMAVTGLPEVEENIELTTEDK